jgi:hypothetical protein
MGLTVSQLHAAATVDDVLNLNGPTVKVRLFILDSFERVYDAPPR